MPPKTNLVATLLAEGEISKAMDLSRDLILAEIGECDFPGAEALSNEISQLFTEKGFPQEGEQFYSTAQELIRTRSY
ncbi:hypothetical protein HN604_01255 [archaeon]|jgi:hypothetical protein|nr:hypothetical protein [archaeon]MBT6606755.1 hypothetical protein [archaeon]MBT7251772.1 hypothetical protein [archaeon]MBT7660691.1 hypothetical protein [archaeon]